MTVTPYGRLADGRPVQSMRLGREDGLALEVLDYGAIFTRMCVRGRHGPVEVLPRLPSLAGYEADGSYLNAAIGRFANRIDRGRFTLDGEMYQIPANEGANTLHGGRVGFNKRIWTVERAEPDHAVLTYTSEDGEEGFPGAVEVTLDLNLSAADTLAISYEATASRATPINLTHHLYFNLSGDPAATILDHRLRLLADAFTPTRPDLIPTGEIASVDGRPLDLRRGRKIGEVVAAADPQLALAKGLDHNFVLTHGAGHQVELTSSESGLTLEIATDQPGMQVYSGQGMDPPFRPHAAIVFEPQTFPDAMNHPNFPDCILRPGQAYRHTSVYRFRR